MTNRWFDPSRRGTSSLRGSREASTAADVRGKITRAAEGRRKVRKKKNRSPGPVSVSDGGDVAEGEIARPKQRRKQRRSASPVSDADGGLAQSSGEASAPPVREKRCKLPYRRPKWNSRIRNSALLSSEVQDDDSAGEDAQAAEQASAAPSGRKASMLMILKGPGEGKTQILEQADLYLSDPPTNRRRSEEAKKSSVVVTSSTLPSETKPDIQSTSISVDNLDLLFSENQGFFAGVRDDYVAQEDYYSAQQIQQAAGQASAAPSGREVSRENYSPLLGTQIFQQDDPHLSDPRTNHCRSEEAKKSSLAVTSGTLLLETKPDIQSPPRSAELGNIAGENAEQLDRIPNVIDHEQDKGPEEIEGLDWDDTKLEKEIDRYLGLFTFDLPSKDDEDFWYYRDKEQLKSLKAQLALHRIRAHRIWEGAKLEELKDAELMKDCTTEVLEDEGYYRHFEWDFEWYFDGEYCKQAGFQDYQRLVLQNTGDYLEWSYYCETLCTHEGDQEFVEFYENLSRKTKWIVNFLRVNQSEWPRYETVAFYHAVKNAASYPNIFERLIYFGFQEYIWSIRFDNVRCKEIATLYFEIWKRVAKGKMEFVEALEQVNDLAVCAPCRMEMQLELDYKPGSGPLRDNYETYVSCIDREVKEDEAYSLIMEAVKIFVRKPKTYYDYAKKKLDIARENGIIPPRDSKFVNNSNGQ